MTDGPIEQALASAVRAHRDPTIPSDLRLEDAMIEPSFKLVVGEFKVDLRLLLPPRTPATKAICKQVAQSLAAVASIDKAIGIPPRVYLTTNTGFLYRQVVGQILDQSESYGRAEQDHTAEGLTLVSFSSPNANKSLHLGHLRNNFIGMALASMLEDQGYDVKRAEVVSDWGVHICQAILAYQKWGKGTTPDSSGTKGDHFVGRYYVMFHDENERELKAGTQEGPSNVSEATLTALEQQAAALLGAMEAGDEKLTRLNQVITGWAEKGIRETYARIGTRFDLIFYEKDTLALAKELIAKALNEGKCHRRDDGSVYIDLTDVDLGMVTLIRRDGTPVVYTTLLGFCVSRYERFPFNHSVSVFGEQWEAGIAVVDEILRRMGYDWVSRMERVHYGMVALPEGRMRSREGTVVTADSLLDRLKARFEGDWQASLPPPLDPSEKKVCDLLGVGLVKYHFLQTKCVKDVMYEEESLWERTLPQFASILKTLATTERAPAEIAPGLDGKQPPSSRAGAEAWRALLLHLNAFPRTANRACIRREPGDLVRYLDEACLLTKACRRHIEPEDPLWKAASIVIRRCLKLLNIELPDSLQHLPPSLTLEPISPLLGTSARES